MSLESGQATTGIETCNSAESFGWDKILNDRYKEIIAIGQDNGLKDIERRWLKLKNDKCNLLSKQEEGGTASGVIYSYCDLAETANQAIYLMQDED